MRIGLSFDTKPREAALPAGAPDDLFEEYDPEETVAAIESAIWECGHDVVRLGGGREFLQKILKERLDFVFNIAEGSGHYRSREAQVPSVLEMMDIPYSGSDPQCLAVCLDKPLTKKVVALAGVRTPDYRVFSGPGQVSEAKGRTRVGPGRATLSSTDPGCRLGPGHHCTREPR